MKIVGAIFEKIKVLNLFLGELPLILRVDRKRKGELDIFARGPQISNVNEFGQLVQALRYATENKKYIILVIRIFQGTADSAILLRFKCTINSQNLMKIVGAIFGKMKILNFFLCELPLILRVDRKRKGELKMFARGPQISNVSEIGQLVQVLHQVTDIKLKTIFSSFRDISRKSRWCPIVELRMYYKPTKFDQNRWNHF